MLHNTTASIPKNTTTIIITAPTTTATKAKTTTINSTLTATTITTGTTATAYKPKDIKVKILPFSGVSPHAKFAKMQNFPVPVYSFPFKVIPQKNFLDPFYKTSMT